MNGLRKKTMSALKWSFQTQALVQGLNFLTWIILARLLLPKDFGEFAIILIITRALHLIRNLALSEAIIKEDNLDKQLFSSIWIFHILLSFLFSAIGYILFLLISGNSSISIQPFFIVLMLGEFLVNGVSISPASLLEKKLDFSRLFKIEVVAVVFSSVIGISLAYKDAGVYSLAFKILSYTLIRSIWLVKLVSDFIEFSYSWEKVKSMFSFSLPLFGSQVLQFFGRNIDDIFIGSVMGSIPLGLYNRAYAIMLLPIGSITNTLSRVFFPAFSYMQDDVRNLSRQYLELIKIISMVTFPIMVGVFVLIDRIVYDVLGSQWQDMIPVVKVLSLLGMLQSVSSLNGTIFKILNKTRIQFVKNVLSTIAYTLTFGLSVFYLRSLTLISLVYFIVSLVIGLCVWVILGRYLHISIIDILKKIIAPLLLSILFGVSLFILDQLLTMNSIYSLSALITYYALFYFILIRFWNQKLWVRLKSMAKA